MTKTAFNLTETAKIANKSRSTVQRMVAAGKLSVNSGPEGKRVEASEIIRVFGSGADFEKVGSAEAVHSELADAKLGARYEAMQEQLAAQQKELVLQHEKTVERLSGQLDKALDFPKLLEDHRSSQVDREEAREKRWEAAMEAAITMAANQTQERLAAVEARHEKELEELRESMGRELRVMKKQVIRERNKTVWQRLFG